MRDLHETWAQDWRRDGMIVVRSLFDPATVAGLSALCEGAIARSQVHDPHLARARDPAEIMIRNLHHPAYVDAMPGGRAAALEAVAHPAALALGRAAFGAEPQFRCTSLIFEGTGAGHAGFWHRDSQFMAADEQAERRMIAERAGSHMQLQIALAPSDDLTYVPGSQTRWDEADEWQVRCADGRVHASGAMPGARRIALEPGDAVAFDPMGLHSGRVVAGRARRAWMLTLTAPGAGRSDHFSRQPWFLESGYLDGLTPATTAFFGRFVEAHREFWSQPAVVAAT